MTSFTKHKFKVSVIRNLDDDSRALNQVWGVSEPGVGSVCDYRLQVREDCPGSWKSKSSILSLSYLLLLKCQLHYQSLEWVRFACGILETPILAISTVVFAFQVFSEPLSIPSANALVYIPINSDIDPAVSLFPVFCTSSPDTSSK